MKHAVLITGASRGIGAACASAAAGRGWPVLVHYHRGREAAEALCASLRAAGGRAETIGFDVADRPAVMAALEPWLDRHGPLAGLVVNAGIRRDAPMVMMQPREWREVLEVNLDGFYHVVKPVLKGMLLARRGRIVAISSFAGRTGTAGQVNYAAAKAGLLGAVKALAREAAKRGVTVNAVSPGYIQTDFLGGLDVARLAGNIPLGRLGRAEDVAAAVTFLLSDDAAYVTGQVLGVNGGMQ